MIKLTHIAALLALSFSFALAGCVVQDGSYDEMDSEDALMESENVEEAASELTALGGSCSADSQCWSGYCAIQFCGGRPDGDSMCRYACAPRSANGSYCPRDAACYSNNCVNNVCTAN